MLHTAKAGSIEARWVGEVVPDAPKTFGIEHLEFVFGDETLVFEPSGTLHFSDWSFAVFSPDGTWTVLLQDRHGPFHAVRTENLEAYLRGEAKPEQVLAPEATGGFVPVLTSPSWTAPHTFHYVVAGEKKTPVAVPLPD